MNEGRFHLSLGEETNDYQIYISYTLKEENWANLQFLSQGHEPIDPRE